MIILIDLCGSSGAEGNFDSNNWLTNGWLEPRKAFDWFIKMAVL